VDIMTNETVVTLTQNAIEKVKEALEEGDFEGIRLTVTRKSGDFIYKFDRVEKGKADPGDIPIPCGDYRFFIRPDSEPLIRGSVIDYVRAGFTQAWMVDNPNPAWDSDLAREISKLFDEVINPGVSEHGGHIRLVNLKENIVYVEMSGGCQGCAMAGKTLTYGVMKTLSEKFPQITQLIDVTNHSDGTKAYYKEEGAPPAFKS